MAQHASALIAQLVLLVSTMYLKFFLWVTTFRNICFRNILAFWISRSRILKHWFHVFFVYVELWN